MDQSTARSRHPDVIRMAFLWALLPSLTLLLIVPSIGSPEVPIVSTAISPTPTGGGNLHTIVTPSSVSTDICTGNCIITGGTRPGGGSNLFHSFGQFNVGSGDITTFQNGISFDLNGTQLQAGLQTSNILARVTGNIRSDIFGTISTTTDFGNANLFLINPSGIVLGPHGSVDVGGSVSFSTAQYLRLFDSVNGVSLNFYANPASDSPETNSVFAMAPVDAFGFLPAAYGFLTVPDPTATITVQGSTLSVLPGQSISLVGGKVVIEGGAQFLAPNGRIHLASTASPGEFAALSGESLANATTLQAVPNNPEVPTSSASFTSFGSVSLMPGSSVDVSSASTVFVKDGQLVLSINDATLNTSENTAPQDTISLSRGSSIVTSNSGATPGADVQVMASNVQLDGASVQSTTTGDGRGGNISITDAQSVSLTNGAQIMSDTKGGGDGGNIAITTANAPDSSVTISEFDSTGTLSGVVNPFFGSVTSGVFSTASAGGHGGQISISAPNVRLDNEGTIATFNSGVGEGGGIAINSTTVKVGPTIEAWIFSITGLDSTFAPVDSGNGGDVTIHGLSGAEDSAADKVMLGSGAQITSIAGGPSSGGDILITSGEVDLDTGASINSGFTGVGDGGNITVNVDTLSLTNSAAIKSLNESVRLGKGGDITVQGLPVPGALDNPATFVTLSSGANITSETSAPDPGGGVLIISKDVQLDTGASINSSTSGSGAGGNITAMVDTLELMNGALITSKTSSLESRPPDSPEFAQGGNITVQGLPGATDNPPTSVTLTTGSGITMETFGSGHGGQVAITSKSLTMNNGIIATATSDTGDGGDIVVNVSEALLLGGAAIKSTTIRGVLPNPNAPHAGNGGRVTVQGLDGDTSKADFFIVSDRSGIISTSNGEGRLGNIEVYAKTVRLTDVGVIQVGTQLDTGNDAGDVIIDANSVSISGGSSIRSQVKFADAGRVTITADQLNLNDGTIEVSTHGIGNGGNVFLNVGSMSLANGATIASSSFSADPGAGDAGNVTITSSGAFTSDASTIATSAENAKGGDILIDAQNVQLSNGTLVSASSRSPLLPDGAGNAGNITITSDSNVVMQNSSVTTEASHASGGSIEIDASDAGMIQLVNSQVSTSVGGSVGVPGASDGGNITIDPQFVILQNSQILAQAFAGAGGAITITAASAYIADPLSIVNASSTLGISGTVNIQSPLQNVGGELTALTQEFSSAAALLAQQCAARAADGKFSTFVVAAREGLPMEPGGFLASPSLTPELLGPSLSLRDPQSQFSAVTGLFPKYDAKPIQLAKLGNACHQ